MDQGPRRAAVVGAGTRGRTSGMLALNPIYTIVIFFITLPENHASKTFSYSTLVRYPKLDI